MSSLLHPLSLHLCTSLQLCFSLQLNLTASFFILSHSFFITWSGSGCCWRSSCSGSSGGSSGGGGGRRKNRMFSRHRWRWRRLPAIVTVEGIHAAPWWKSFFFWIWMSHLHWFPHIHCTNSLWYHRSRYSRAHLLTILLLITSNIVVVLIEFCIGLNCKIIVIILFIIPLITYPIDQVQIAVVFLGAPAFRKTPLSIVGTLSLIGSICHESTCQCLRVRSIFLSDSASSYMSCVTSYFAPIIVTRYSTVGLRTLTSD